MFGLIIALIVVLIIFAILVAFLLVKVCCCCSSKNFNKEKYYVSHAPTYKSIDPIYIVTPTLRFIISFKKKFIFVFFLVKTMLHLIFINQSIGQNHIHFNTVLYH